MNEEHSDNDPLEEWEILTEVVMALVSRPDAVRIRQRQAGNETHLTIQVAKEDLGMVIGKNGGTLLVLRKLFARIAASRGKKTFIHIEDPAKIRESPRHLSRERNAAA